MCLAFRDASFWPGACSLRGVRIRLRFWRDGRGFSVTEVTTILTALSILSGAAAPAVSDYVEEAKLIRARSDVRTIGISLVRLFSDVGGERDIEGGWGGYDLLVGGGAAPGAGTAAAVSWSAVGGPRVGLLDDHLISNGPGYTARRATHRSGWRGAYLQDPVSADPWGHRYAVNVSTLKSRYLDTVVLSAGPDGVVDSPFERDGLPTAA